VNKHLAALQDFYVWRGLGQPQGVRRHQVPRHAPRALDPRAKLRYLRAVEAWPGARDRAIALLPLYAGTRIAEITALDNGATQEELAEAATHLAFYAGWPAGMSVAEQVVARALSAQPRRGEYLAGAVHEPP
jgi:site-specific recombinase XerC